VKLVTTNRALENTFSRLVAGYANVALAVAWATANTSVFKQLVAQSSRVRKAIIGTHFYQTHPDVLDAFVGSEAVRFMLQPKGVFHPKLYVFWNAVHWEALIGSANLTSAALSDNSEVMVLFSEADTGIAKEQLLGVIDDYWDRATAITREESQSYRAIWERQQPALHRLSGQYGKGVARRPPLASSVMSMTWDEFVGGVQKDEYHSFEERCQLLQLVRTEFLAHPSFGSMELGVRKTIAGLPNDWDHRWGWFGSMKGLGYYHQAVNDNNPHLSDALDRIPSTEPVSKAQYLEYLSEFLRAFPDGGCGVGVASRLLALKRPDQFVCLDSKNKRNLCKDFGIKQAEMTYDRYWDEIIERIMDSPWWNCLRPHSEKDAVVWDGRVAMLDVIFYEA
jgi:hypothetical protein